MKIKYWKFMRYSPNGFLPKLFFDARWKKMMQLSKRPWSKKEWAEGWCQFLSENLD